jgi:ABC-2 type transport system permease protein
MLASLMAIRITIGLVPVGKQGPGVRPLARHLSFTPLIETLRGLLSGPSSAGPVIMAIAGCAKLSLLGYLWVRTQVTKRA